MHVTQHTFEDGYGLAVTLQYLGPIITPAGPAATYCYLGVTTGDAEADVTIGNLLGDRMLDADDCRSLAEVAAAMAVLLDAEAARIAGGDR